MRELQWGDVEGWSSLGGAELGISRHVPTVKDLYAIGRGLEEQRVDGLLIVGGWDAFEAAYTMHRERERYPAFDIPTICCRPPSTTTSPARSCRWAPTARST